MGYLRPPKRKNTGKNNMKTFAITTAILSGLLLVYLGYNIKTCTPCKENTPIIKYIERKETIKKLEDEIIKINISTDRVTRDSLRSAINPR